MDNQKSFLELKVVWKDDDMFELKVLASNGRYTGTTEVYDTSDSLGNFAKSLIGFPTVDIKTLKHEAGQKDNYSYFAMAFYCIDNSGHIGVQIELEENVATNYRKEEKDKIKLEIIVVPRGIDKFQKELLQLATTQNGVAILYGQDTPNDL
ncbi:MAG: hypothetical protein LCH91_28540 [Bacteroidetes bacterium]|nr:hypothetical protein [Bacteroidota bacterium]